jgi:carboxyl-terminal processing protease
VVYGGGGITPDIFVPEDTSDYTSYYKEASMSGLIIQFGYDYTDQNRSTLKEYGDEASLLKHIKKQNLVEKFAQYAEKHGLKRRNLMIQKSHHLLESYIYSRVIYNMLSEQAWLQYLNEDDPAIRETLRLFEAGEAFPKSPDLKDAEKKKTTAKCYDYRAVHQSYVVVARA